MTESCRHIGYVLGKFPVLSETFISNEIRAVGQRGVRTSIFSLRQSAQIEAQMDDADLVKACTYLQTLSADQKTEFSKMFKHSLPEALPFLYKQESESIDHLLGQALQVAAYARRNECTHLHAHFGWAAAAVAIVAARLTGLPCSFTCHGSDVYRNPADLPLKCEAANMVISVSPRLTSHLKRLAPGANIQTLYCGIDTARFKPSELAQPNNRWLFIGRLIECKGVEDLVEAWSHIPEKIRPMLDIAGDGELKERIVRRINELELAKFIHMVGSVQSTWLEKYGPEYQGMVLPFKPGKDGSHDTFPQTLKEGMAMGLPIVTTELGDFPDLLPSACKMVPTGNAQAIARAVTQVMELGSTEIKQLRQNMRQYVTKNTEITVQSGKLVDLLCGVC